MNIHELNNLPDDTELVVTAGWLKLLAQRGQMMASGFAPKGEMCFMYGKDMLALAESAELLKWED